MPSRRGLLLVVLVAAGCGSTTLAQERPVQNRPTFRTEARKACAGLERRLSRVAKSNGDRVWVELADAWTPTLDKLRELDAPPELRPRFQRMLAHFDNAVRAARAIPGAEDELVLAPIAALMEQGGKGATIARSLGLLRCSAVPPEPTAAERERANDYLLREARRAFEPKPGFRRLDQAAHPGRMRPRIEASPGS